MSAAPPRKFAPVPVEETTKSSRQRAGPAIDPPKSRRFAPEPIEQTVKSSKHAAPPATEGEKPKPRRFAPEPVEQSMKSSKDASKAAAEQEVKPKPRRFAPQLVAESGKSSKDKAPPAKHQHVKFTPEPIATTYGSNRKAKGRDLAAPSGSAGDGSEKKIPRKFTPILLDTATRSRRAGDANAPISQDYRTEYGYHAHARDHWKRVTGQVTPAGGSEQAVEDDGMDVDQASSASDTSSQQRRLAPLDGSAPKRPACLRPQRAHSFRAPDLDTIESSESEEESDRPISPPTPDQEGSPVAVTNYEMFKHATRRRESIDDNFQHYLLDLERKKAQERLEEQALAAYPNADFGYEHPHHYFLHDEDDSDEYEIEDRPVTWDGNEDDMLEMDRRESTVNLSWEKSELQRHAEEVQQERNALKTTAKTTAKPATQSPFMKLDTLMAEGDVDLEVKSMRDRARPPMLGSDLVFPRCASPDPARFDVTQGSTALRNQMCYLTAAADAERKRSGQDEGLWQAKQPNKKRISTVKSPASPTLPSAQGLWGGFCINDGKNGTGFGSTVQAPTNNGLMTPKQEAPNPFQLTSRPGESKTPKTPTKSSNPADLRQLQSILVTEREIDQMMEREYPDSFITQVYNYLSLGYPSIARSFDDELAKIGRIPIAELRDDDQKAKAEPRGYIRLGSDFEGGGGEGMVEENCMRWQALKRYVREWAKQEKNWAPNGGGAGNWGTGARRGSWAI